MSRKVYTARFLWKEGTKIDLYVAVISGMSNAEDDDVLHFDNDFLSTSNNGGVVDKAGGDFLVEAQSSPDMSVKVNTGVAYVWATSLGIFCRVKGETSTETLNISNNASGSTRYDLICIKIDPSASPDADASNVASLVVVEGTPGGGVPATPANHLKFAEVEVINGASSITNSKIVDTRDWVKATKLSFDQPFMSMHRQALINGNFGIWQRGTSFTNPANNAFTADRFHVSFANDGGTPPTLVHTRQALTPGDIAHAFYFYRIAPNGAGSGYGNDANYQLKQTIEHGTRFLCGSGKKVTVSFYARSSIANKKLGIALHQHYGTGGSPSSGEVINGASWTLTSSWVKYTFTFTTNTLSGKTFGTGNDDYLGLFFMFIWGSNKAAWVGTTGAEDWVGSGNIDIAQAQVCAGDVALPYQPKSFWEELRACQRYYEKSFAYATAPADVNTIAQTTPAITISTTAIYSHHYYQVRKRVVPTITFYNDAGGTAGKWDYHYGGAWQTNKTPAVDKSLETYFQSLITTTGLTANTAGLFRGHWTADAELV